MFSRYRVKFLLLCSFYLLSGISSYGVAQPSVGDETEDSTLTYPATFFAQFDPVSVNDMLARIPGIEMALSDNEVQFGNNNNRGLGGSSQILIDGKRLAGKANEAASQLDRIAASEVDYIEIIRGTSSELDVQNSGQMVNIVLKQAGSRSNISAEAGVLRYHDGEMQPEASVSLTGQSGRLSYLFNVSSSSNYQLIESSELSLHPDLSFNELVEFEREQDATRNSLNTNLTFDFSPSDRLALNLLYTESDPPSSLFRIITDFNLADPTISYERENVPATSSNWELGGDYEHSFEDGGRFKLLFIVNDRSSDTTRERFDFATLQDDESKNLFLRNSSGYAEKIVRTSYTWDILPGQGLELGIEAAQTTQDSDLRLGLPLGGAASDLHGGLTAVPLPNANSTVEEIRYEAFAVHNWRINSRMSLESSLILENSEIEQSGDIDNKRDFDFLKPKFDFRFDISNSFQMRVSAEKIVSQLSFADFSAATNNRDEDQDTIAGNPELEQEETWRYNLNLDYRLPNDGGVLNSRLFYFDRDQSIGRIDISPSADNLQTTNGNVGRGQILGLDLNGSIRFGFLGFPQALLTAGVLFQDSWIDDPLIAMERKVVPYDRGAVRLGFRHDLPDLGINYGFNYFDGIDGNRPFWDIDNVLYIGSPSGMTVFAEKSGIAGLTYRFEIRNALDHVSKQERRRYAGYLRDDVLTEIERFSVNTGTTFSFKVRGTF